MAKCSLIIGQSLANAMCNLSSGSLTPHPDTHIWNGSSWSAPVGDGAILYANCLREALQEHIYLVNAAVDGMPMMPSLSGMFGGCWGDANGWVVANAISRTQAALATVPGLALDRVEFWQGQSDAMYGAGDLFNGYLSPLGVLDSTLRAAFGSGFRFCVWPLGKVGLGNSQQVIRAQIVFSMTNNPSGRGVEPGPASYDRAYASGSNEPTHLLNAVEYGCMGIRGARNALSYFVAKANNAASIPHHGAGPMISSLIRHPAKNRMLAVVDVKPGFRLLARNIWDDVDPNMVTGFGLAWGTGDHAPLAVTGAQVCGGYVRVFSDTTLVHPVWLGYQQHQGCDAQFAVYDNNDQWIGGYGQPMLPHPLEMHISA